MCGEPLSGVMERWLEDLKEFAVGRRPGWAKQKEQGQGVWEVRDFSVPLFKECCQARSAGCTH